jgi:hypothetical protein
MKKTPTKNPIRRKSHTVPTSPAKPLIIALKYHQKSPKKKLPVRRRLFSPPQPTPSLADPDDESTVSDEVPPESASHVRSRESARENKTMARSPENDILKKPGNYLLANAILKHEFSLDIDLNENIEDIENQERINAELEKYYGDLQKIMAGSLITERSSKWNEGAKARQVLLWSWMPYFLMNDQATFRFTEADFDRICKILSAKFPNVKESYLNSVLVPEMVVRVISGIHGISLDEVWKQWYHQNPHGDRMQII